MADVLRLTGLTVDCVVGAYPAERHRPQPLELALALHLDLEPAARAERLSATVDYAVIAESAAFLLRAGRFRLLETAALALLRLLLVPPAPGEPRPGVLRASVTIAKPRALPGAAVPSVRLERAAGEVAPRRSGGPDAPIDVLHDGEETRATRLAVRAGAPVPDGALFLLAGAVSIEGRPVERAGPLPPPVPDGEARAIAAGPGGAVLIHVARLDRGTP